MYEEVVVDTEKGVRCFFRSLFYGCCEAEMTTLPEGWGFRGFPSIIIQKKEGNIQKKGREFLMPREAAKLYIPEEGDVFRTGYASDFTAEVGILGDECSMLTIEGKYEVIKEKIPPLHALTQE